MQVPNPVASAPAEARHALSAAEFRRRFRWLIFHTWNIPPVFGLGFILLIGVLTPAQILGILITPLEPAYIIGWLVFALWLLPRSMRPLADWLDNKPGSSPEQAVRAVRRFPLIFWATFLTYLVLAPASVIFAAEMYTGFIATPYDWFRIELVALIVSIIVGLPIFFLIFDLFGQALGGLELKRPIITVKTKVFLIGALVPLLIDTMLVQYYWTRTGYFTFETFGVWLLLEALAIGGSLIFAHSFGQSLDPLQKLIGAPRPLPVEHIAALRPRSTDELGLLTADYRKLLEELQLRNEILEINNRLLRTVGSAEDTGAALTAVVNLCQEALSADQAFLIVHDDVSGDLIGVAQTGSEYRADGHWRVHADEPSLALWVFNQGLTVTVEDMASDPRVSDRVREAFNTKSAIATPVHRDGKKLGVLTATQHNQPRTYSARDIALIEGLAREAALALQTQQLRQARAQAEAARREQAEQVQLLMDTTEEGIYGVNDAGFCTFINRAALRMLGYARPEELLGRNLHDLIHHTLPDGRPYPKVQCRVRLAMLAGETVHADDEVHWRADGTSFPVEYWSRPIVRDGKTVGTVVSFVDITDRKASEMELNQYREHLEELVQLRTAELETVNRELEAFSYSVSHDLRAPLRAIDGFARALSEDFGDRLDDTAQDYLHRVWRGTKHMGELIDDMLQLSRVSRSDLRLIDIDLSAMAEEIITSLQTTASGRHAEVEIAAGLRAYGDARLLRVALTNLLDNAWKYTGKVARARIALGREQIDGRAVFYVRDNGAGFDMQYAGKLFGAFQRLHSTQEYPGTGIGLATVARIIHRHGGRVWAEGQVGKGATFFFTLAGTNAPPSHEGN